MHLKAILWLPTAYKDIIDIVTGVIQKSWAKTVKNTLLQPVSPKQSF